MGIIGALTKAGIAKKVFDEARKPQNQEKLKALVANARRRRATGTR